MIQNGSETRVEAIQSGNCDVSRVWGTHEGSPFAPRGTFVLARQ
jgi:hypothetical protein